MKARCTYGVMLVVLWVLLCSCSLRAEFLFAPENPTDNGFFTPTLTFIDGEYEYSAWDIFYAPHSVGNYPDIFAPAGGVWDDATGTWKPESRTSAGFPASPYYNPQNAFAFWDTYNPTITQTLSNTTFIIGPDISGNIYTFQSKTAYQLHNAPDYDQLGTVIFQFQTDGTNVDFSKIRLAYMGEDGNKYYIGVNDPETEYLREYSTTGSDHWSATAGYRNRVLFQWDLSGVIGTGEYWIEWESQSSSMSFQKADLITASYYEVGMPVSSTWVSSGAGNWSDSSNWTGQAGGTPLENGNLKFKNTAATQLDIDDADHLVGEVIFENAADVTIGSIGNYKLTANTGVTTRSDAVDAADRVYTFDADYEFGALNFFEINTGTVVMNGTLSGNYGMVKLGAGTLELNGNNSFTQFLAVQDGTLILRGSNAYTGSTTVVNGRVIAAHSSAFGNGSGALIIGGDADLYAFTTNASSWLAELVVEGDLAISRDISLGAGDLGKRLGAFNTIAGAEFSGAISFSGVVANPDAVAGSTAVGNTRLTAESVTDRLIFSGQMTGGSNQKTVTMDGLGTVVYAGVNKTYNTSTHVASGTLLIEAGTSYTGGGHWSVASGALLQVNGGLAGTGNLNLNGGTITGSGDINRSFTVAGGSVISPGNSVGVLGTISQTWGAGGVYLWEIASVASTPGIGWDLLDITGVLTITATSANPFEIRIASLGLVDFDELSDYAWIIGTATGGIAGFDTARFFINTDGFDNSFTGTFGIEVTGAGNELTLTYSAVPEPSTWLLITVAMTFLVWKARRGSRAVPVAIRTANTFRRRPR